jgi:peptidoglycan/LPS O-acetylase OafA/YrhL
LPQQSYDRSHSGAGKPINLFQFNSFVKAERRVPGIDLVRGLCIIAVVLHHINLRIRFHESAFGKMIGPAADKVLFWSGYYGVRVFFVLSGFLITTWSLKRWGTLRNISLRQFYLMRFARIAPCLLGLLALLAVLDRAGVPRFTINIQHTSLVRALFAALTFHINWLEARTGYLPAAWDVLWSLSVEEVFYVFFPLLCILVRQRLLLIAVLAVFIIAGPFARIVWTQNDLWADYGYLSCMDGIAFGCLAAMCAANIKLGDRANLTLRLSGTVLCALIVVFRGTAARLGFYKVGLDVTILEVGTVLLVIAFQQQFDEGAAQAKASSSITRSNLTTFLRATAGFPSALLRWFGRNSYEVYLIHMLVVWPMVMVFQRMGFSLSMSPIWFFATTALAGAAGQVVSQFYSEPLNRMLRRSLLTAAPGAKAFGASTQ